MWSPTHVQVTVQRARNLRAKGRNSTNDAFVVIQMGKEKFQTTVKEKSVIPEWHEECDFNFKPDQPVVLVAYHRNLFGLDEFLGEVLIPLDMSNRHTSKWYKLSGKGNKQDGKYRGEIETTISFIVRNDDVQSLNEFAMSKKKRASISGIATSVGHKLRKLPGKAMTLRSEAFDPQGRLAKLRDKRNSCSSDPGNNSDTGHTFDDCDSLYDEFDAAPDVKPSSTPPLKSLRKYSSIYSSTLSLPQSAMITSSIQEDKSLEEQINNSKGAEEEEVWDSFDKIPTSKSGYGSIDFPPTSFHSSTNNRISSHMKDLTRSEINLFDSSLNNSNGLGKHVEKKNAFVSIKNTLRRHTMQLAEPPDFSSMKILSPAKTQLSNKKFLSQGKESPAPTDVPPEVLKQYEKISRQDLVVLAIQQQTEVEKLKDKISDMEAYLDNLLVRVMETTPKILQTPYETLNPAVSR